jgi:hypothetical protein
MGETAKVTKEGILVRRPLIEGWGDVEEVEIEQRPDAIMITPKGAAAVQLRDRIIDEMKAAGLVEETPWTPPPAVSEAERARLAAMRGQGKPLSEIIIEEREDRA